VTNDVFDPRTRAKMEFALELACRGLPSGRQGHEWRRIVAEDIILCARDGKTSLEDLSAAGRRSVVDKLGGSVINPVPPELLAG